MSALENPSSRQLTALERHLLQGDDQRVFKLAPLLPHSPEELAQAEIQLVPSAPKKTKLVYKLANMPDWLPEDELGYVYILEFSWDIGTVTEFNEDGSIKHRGHSARYYIGWAKRPNPDCPVESKLQPYHFLKERLKEHRTAQGAAITAAAVKTYGCTLRVVHTTEGSRRDEFRYKCAHGIERYLLDRTINPLRGIFADPIHRSL